MGAYRTLSKAVGAMAAAVILAMVGTGTATAAPKTTPLPVNYNFFGGIPNELANPGGSLPGSNDFSCKPSAEHPNPVVLLHGTGGGAQTNWGPMVPALKNAGYCVFALTYGALPGSPWPISAVGGAAPIEYSSGQVARFVDRVLAATKAKKVDMVGHSQGTVLPTYYARYLGAGKLDKAVGIAPFWRGTGGNLGQMAQGIARALGIPETSLPWFSALGQAITGSKFMTTKIWVDGTPYAPGVKYTNISTRYDQLILPYTSGQVPGKDVTNIVTQNTCPTDFSDHLAVAASRRTVTQVLNALDPAHPRPVPCYFVPPVTGA